jgi:hypothetical protein
MLTRKPKGLLAEPLSTKISDLTIVRIIHQILFKSQSYPQEIQITLL